jgi:hypothetical protein
MKMEDLTHTINQVELIEISKTHHTVKAKHIFFISAHETGHVLEPNRNQIKMKRIQIIQSVFSGFA